MRVRTDPIVSVWRPKPGGGYRRMARLSGPDAARWDALGARVAPAVEASLCRNVVANRAVGGGRRWSLEPLGSALRRARRLARGLGAGMVLRTDVAAFYASVAPSVLFRSLSGVGVAGDDAREAAELVERWASDGYPGLPIGPPASAVLANAVLVPVDRELAGRGFLRWVDDYLVELRCPPEMHVVIDMFDQALGRQGLVRSEAKTAVLSRARPWPGRLAASAAP